ncbi:metallo-beta-lactamase class B [Neolewinella xylanilytica]|uniref:beta-lactamase n=1 Tax=Neolewinella xylanilytica TaxID=1514080 RepID=A0A2S6I7A4_9BACT|nr:subclass B1 metallo-beta-lactamase [Neolewinella xylanilytica]PPK87383.1 metallo-beta-lactamase class B [Neolewinella xylanilytica]
MKWLLPVLLCFACRSSPQAGTDYTSETLTVNRLTDHTYRHLTYLDVPGYGRVPCNGLIVVNDGEALVFDSPSTDATAGELVDFIGEELGATIKAVVATHFHDDCVGGLAAFHGRGIPSYGLAATVRRAQEEGNPVPENAFDKRISLSVGDIETLTLHPGPGHTPDNVVAYVPADRVLFGGCLVKETGATKGNLADADTARWSATIGTVRDSFPRLRVVVPGHGEPGGPELLTYTAELFDPER